MSKRADEARDNLGAIAAERVSELGDDIDPDVFALSFSLFRSSARFLQDLEATVHRPRGLSLAGFRVLFTTWIHGQLEPRELARLAGVSRAAVSGVLKTLERDGLVSRARDQADGRLVTVRATEEGVDLLRNVYQAQNRRERQHFASLTPGQLRQFEALMQLLLQADLPPADDGDS